MDTKEPDNLSEVDLTCVERFAQDVTRLKDLENENRQCKAGIERLKAENQALRIRAQASGDGKDLVQNEGSWPKEQIKAWKNQQLGRTQDPKTTQRRKQAWIIDGTPKISSEQAMDDGQHHHPVLPMSVLEFDEVWERVKHSLQSIIVDIPRIPTTGLIFLSSKSCSTCRKRMRCWSGRLGISEYSDVEVWEENFDSIAGSLLYS